MQRASQSHYSPGESLPSNVKNIDVSKTVRCSKLSKKILVDNMEILKGKWTLMEREIKLQCKEVR